MATTTITTADILAAADLLLEIGARTCIGSITDLLVVGHGRAWAATYNDVYDALGRDGSYVLDKAHGFVSRVR